MAKHPHPSKRDPLADSIVGGDDAPLTSEKDPFPPPVTIDAPVEEPKKIAVPPKAKAANTKQYKVTADVRIAWHKGQFISLHVGDVVNESLYGTGAIALLLAAGVKLEEV